MQSQRSTVAMLMRTIARCSNETHSSLQQQRTAFVLARPRPIDSRDDCNRLQQRPHQLLALSCGYAATKSRFLADISRSYIKYTKFSLGHDPPVLGAVPLSKERAHEVVSMLKDSEREELKAALEKFDAMRIKEGFEGKLAATQWRSRFGRPSKVPALGDVDPTGSFCAFPEDWLKKKAVENAKPPQSADLWKIFMVNAVPFIGFGFLDNFTMIIAGDYIDHAFGSFMCISTMAAAGLGNTISDVLGIGSAFYVERGCEMMGLRAPDLTPIQLEMKESRRAANYGRIVGITIGCLVGMFPLLFMDKKPSSTNEGPQANVNPA